MRTAARQVGAGEHPEASAPYPTYPTARRAARLPFMASRKHNARNSDLIHEGAFHTGAAMSNQIEHRLPESGVMR